MAKLYKSVKIVNITAGGGGGGTSIYEFTFTNSTWQASGSEWEIEIPQSAHQLGDSIIIQVEQLVGSAYEEVELSVVNLNGNVTLTVGNNSRFNGRVLITG